MNIVLHTKKRQFSFLFLLWMQVVCKWRRLPTWNKEHKENYSDSREFIKLLKRELKSLLEGSNIKYHKQCLFKKLFWMGWKLQSNAIFLILADVAFKCDFQIWKYLPDILQIEFEFEFVFPTVSHLHKSNAFTVFHSCKHLWMSLTCGTLYIDSNQMKDW